MTTYSPLIKDGALHLTETGDLMVAPDIVTQLTVGISGYNCLYDVNLNSALLPYLNQIPKGNNINVNQVTNIVKSAYTYMIQQKIITNLQIAVPAMAQTLSTVTIIINATDAQGNNVTLNWTNP